MTEQLPVINTSHNVTATKGQSNSLLGRGLAAIQRKETCVVLSDLDSRYRQARDIYNRITDYGDIDRFKVELLPTQEELLNEPLLKQLQPFYDLMKQLADVFAVFQELANQGYGKAYLPLSNMYWGGRGINENKDKAFDYSRLASNWCLANQSLNDTEIWCYLGCLHYYDGENEEATFLYRKAAEQGSAEAQNKLGQMFEFGNCEDGIDYHEAFFLYQKAAHQNYATGQMNYGLMWLGVEDFEQDSDEAIFWFCKAAEQGYADAQFTLGRMYEYGEGVEKDIKQAVFWYRKAARQGDAQSQRQLGWMYESGRGVEQDDYQAMFWYLKASEQGDELAQENLINIENNWHEPFSW